MLILDVEQYIVTLFKTKKFFYNTSKEHNGCMFLPKKYVQFLFGKLADFTCNTCNTTLQQCETMLCMLIHGCVLTIKTLIKTKTKLEHMKKLYCHTKL